MKERTDFEEYNSGFFYTRFNRLLRLIRKNRVLPIRPGWEQTPDGIVPPPIYNAQALAARPFQVTVRQDEETNEIQASVNTGYWGLIGGSFQLPSWTGSSDFNNFETIASSSTLRLVLKFAQSSDPIYVGPVGVEYIGWENDAEGTGNGFTEYEIDFSGENVEESFDPVDSYEAEIDIAYLAISGDSFTLTQYVDYNILVPANTNRFYKITQLSV